MPVREGRPRDWPLGKSPCARSVASFLGCSLLGELAREGSRGLSLVSRAPLHGAPFSDFGVCSSPLVDFGVCYLSAMRRRHHVGVALSARPPRSLSSSPWCCEVNSLLQRQVTLMSTGLVTTASLVLPDVCDRRCAWPCEGDPRLFLPIFLGPRVWGLALGPSPPNLGVSPLEQRPLWCGPLLSCLPSGLGGLGSQLPSISCLGWDSDPGTEVTWALTPSQRRGPQAAICLGVDVPSVPGLCWQRVSRDSTVLPEARVRGPPPPSTRVPVPAPRRGGVGSGPTQV